MSIRDDIERFLVRIATTSLVPACWAKTYEDSAFRRHDRKGRYGESRTAALVRGNIRRAKESMQRP